jgi:hypothetical protein
MNAGQGIETVAATILKQRDAKKDYIADTRALAMSERGSLIFKVGSEEKEFAPTENCYRQIGDRVGIPAKYFERMRASAPGLLANNVNHWFQTDSEKRMLRTFQNGSNVARAFLSDRYRPLDNIDIAAHVLPRIEAAGCEIKSTAITDNRLYVQAIIPRLEKKLAKVGDLVQSGVVISNSEIGCGSLWIEHMVYTLRCTNGMIGENVVKRNHVGRSKAGDMDDQDAREYFTDETRKADDRAFWLKVQDMVKFALSAEMFERACARLEKAATVEIENPSEVIEVIGERMAWQENESAAILKHFIKGGSTTQYGLLNAVTRAAEDCESYDRAVELERQGGEILLLKPSDFSAN